MNWDICARSHLEDVEDRGIKKQLDHVLAPNNSESEKRICNGGRLRAWDPFLCVQNPLERDIQLGCGRDGRRGRGGNSRMAAGTGREREEEKKGASLEDFQIKIDQAVLGKDVNTSATRLGFVLRPLDSFFSRFQIMRLSPSSETHA